MTRVEFGASVRVEKPVFQGFPAFLYAKMHTLCFQDEGHIDACNQLINEKYKMIAEESNRTIPDSHY
jgi:hypothetical protein